MNIRKSWILFFILICLVVSPAVVTVAYSDVSMPFLSGLWMKLVDWDADKDGKIDSDKFDFDIDVDMIVAAGVVANSLYGANTILKADTDENPEAMLIAEGTLLGRSSGGAIDALDSTEVKTMLGYQIASDVSTYTETTQDYLKTSELAGAETDPTVDSSAEIVAIIGTLDNIPDGTTYKLLTATKDGYINQDVTSGSSPTFNAANISGTVTGTVEQLHIEARAGTSTIAIGVPVYITSYNVSGFYVVEPADNSNAAKMPAVGLTTTALLTNATEKVAVNGRVTGLVTNAYAQNDPLYVGVGVLTTTKPTGTALIQKMGTVARVHLSAGVIQVVGAGRTNDVPNIADGLAWVGNASGVATATAVATSGGAFHDGFSDFVANEHIDWTTDQGATDIHAGNYTDTNTTYTVANEVTDTTCWPMFNVDATGTLAPKTVAGFTFNSATAILSATGFAGPLVGNVTGNITGSSGSTTGNAATVTNATLTTALTVNTGTVTLTGNVANTSALTLGAGASSVSGVNTGDAPFKSIAVAGLSDTATPSVLTTAESTNHCISNYKATGADHVFTMPAAHVAGNVIFSIGDEFQVDIEPVSSDLFYLNGTAMAADEHIQNTADTLGKRIVGYCVNINGTLRWMFYSSDAAWVEATP